MKLKNAGLPGVGSLPRSLGANPVDRTGPKNRTGRGGVLGPLGVVYGVDARGRVWSQTEAEKPKPMQSASELRLHAFRIPVPPEGVAKCPGQQGDTVRRPPYATIISDLM